MSSINPIVAPPVDVERQEVTEEELAKLGVEIARDFPGSTIVDFQKYPVLSEGGWFEVLKHQPTLTSIVRRPWHLFGPVQVLSTTMEFN